jgi:hypothetical protein
MCTDSVVWCHKSQFDFWAATACLRCEFDACFSKRYKVFRSVAPHCSGCIKRAAAFILVCRLLLPPVLQSDPTLWGRQQTETAFRCFAM